MELPPALRAALDDPAAPLPAKRLAVVSADLSRRYRSGAVPAGPVARTAEEIAAYAATRLPATYAAVRAALEQTRARLPGWRPRALLDVGAGPGTAAWAAAEVWPDLERVTLVEREAGMIALGRRLAASAPSPALRAAAWRQADLTGNWDAAPPDTNAQDDLVVAAYVLGELAPERVAALVAALWERAGGVLLLAEPGTPAGFARIRAARDGLLAAGARTAAPCPHDMPCPMPAGDWCHFAQRVARSRQHRQAKGGDLGYEDEKFAYAAFTRLAPAPTAARVIRHPQTRPGLVQLELCTANGLTRQTVTRKDGERFRVARDLRWGSALPE
ncbi:MAG TPA: small ribosomal subunit Rsm22 family protein [Ktedonobacterales bacterium]|jgi:ribosomal protein RSM22 (predicted rRNA methylase)